MSFTAHREAARPQKGFDVRTSLKLVIGLAILGVVGTILLWIVSHLGIVGLLGFAVLAWLFVGQTSPFADMWTHQKVVERDFFGMLIHSIVGFTLIILAYRMFDYRAVFSTVVPYVQVIVRCFFADNDPLGDLLGGAIMLFAVVLLINFFGHAMGITIWKKPKK